MEQPHLSTQLDYLEQKHQEAQANIGKLEQRLETQAYQLQEQAHQIQQLEEELAQATAQLGRLSQIDEQLTRFKDELLQIVEQQHSRQRPTGPDFGNSMVMQQLDNHTQALNELRREVEKTRRYDDQIALARTEATRLNQEVSKFQAQLDNFGQQLDERARPLIHLEEQRRTDARLVAELRAELEDLRKKIETSLTKVALVEQQIPQFAKYEAALDSIRDDISRHRERMDFQAAQRERQLKSWTELAEETERRLRENEKLMEKYAEHYQLNKRALASLQDFQEQLQREQHHLGELQRLTEERQRAESEKSRADYEQRWKKQSMELQPQLADLQKRMDALQQRMHELAQLDQTLEDQLNMVLQIIEEDIQARAQATSNWQERFEELARGEA